MTGYDSIFRYYATLGLGAAVDLSSDINHHYLPAFQFTPVGVAIGKEVSGYFEIGLGHAFLGFMTGLSWRF